MQNVISDVRSVSMTFSKKTKNVLSCRCSLAGDGSDAAVDVKIRANFIRF